MSAEIAAMAVVDTTSSNSSLSLEELGMGELWNSISNKVTATVTSASRSKTGNHTEYAIRVDVYFENNIGRQWTVERRYSHFDKLHYTLKESKFPCPELPPKQYFAFHTDKFIRERQTALNIWIQGVLCIWQSEVPNAPALPTQAFDVADVLEAFLCEADPERFLASVEHVASGTANTETITSPQMGPTSFASIARTRKKQSVHNLPKIPPTIDEYRSSLSNNVVDSRERSKSTDVSLKTHEIPESIITATAAITTTTTTTNLIPNATTTTTTTTTTNTTPPLLKSNDNSVDGSGNRSAGSSRGNMFRHASMDDLPSIANARVAATKTPTIIPQSNSSSDLQSLSKSVPVNSASIPDYLPLDQILSQKHVGMAVDHQSLAGGSPAVKKYSHFDTEGRKVVKQFRPFEVKVSYPHGSESDLEDHQPGDPCTPLSVPPTPYGQTEFFSAWTQYTHEVLNFVAQRLDKVSKKNNLLDQVENGDVQEEEEEEEETDTLNATKNTAVGVTTTTTTTTTKQKNQAVVGTTNNDLYHIPDDESPMAAVQEGLMRSSTEEQRYRSYYTLGERLVGIIIKESDDGVDLLNSEWEFVANTKNVIISRRKNPIRRKHLRVFAQQQQQQQQQQQLLLQTTTPESSSSIAAVATTTNHNHHHNNNNNNNNSIDFVNTTPQTFTKTPQDSNTVSSTPAQVQQHGPSRQYCFMGRGMVNAPALDIFNVVRRPQNRRSYDRLLKEEILLENLQTKISKRTGEISFVKLASDAGPGDDSDHLAKALPTELSESHFSSANEHEGKEKVVIDDATKASVLLVAEEQQPFDVNVSPIGDLLVYYHLFETNRCFVRYSRDFCVMQYAKGQKNGKYIVVGSSVPHDDCPKRDQVVRSTLPIFGWVIEPINANQSKVTYIIQLDFGGSVPTQLLNTISFRQPLCVHYLAKFMNEQKEKEKEKERAFSISPIPAA